MPPKKLSPTYNDDSKIISSALLERKKNLLHVVICAYKEVINRMYVHVYILQIMTWLQISNKRTKLKNAKI